MSDLRQQIADLEAEIDDLAEAAERCRKIAVVAQIAIAAGLVLFAVTIAGLSHAGATGLLLSIAAALGGFVLLGSNATTSRQIAAAIGVSEARRSQMIDALDLESVEDQAQGRDLSPPL